MKDKIIMADDMMVVNPNAVYIMGVPTSGMFEVRAGFGSNGYYVLGSFKSKVEAQKVFRTICEGYQE